MENYIKRIVKYVLDKKYPEFEGVEVTSERNPQSFYIDKTRNLVYNVFLTIDSVKFLKNDVEFYWTGIESLIRDTIKSIGVENTINVYIDFSDEK
jgi:hypothetical protein